MNFIIPTETNLAEIDENLGTAPTQTNNYSNQFNLSFKGVNHCWHCSEKEKIIYHSKKDEIYCKTCGTVLRQGFTDYEDIIIPQISDMELGLEYYNSFDYYLELFHSTEKQVLGQ